MLLLHTPLHCFLYGGLCLTSCLRLLVKLIKDAYGHIKPSVRLKKATLLHGALCKNGTGPRQSSIVL